MTKEKGNERRKFLIQSLGLGLGTMIGAPAIAQVVKDDTDSGKKTKLLTTDGKVIEVDSKHIKNISEHCCASSGKEAQEGIPNRKFVMVIDLGRCKNARKCVEACQYAHHLRPEQEYIRVIKMQDSKDTAPYWFPKPCFHCDNPSCVSVCPVSATYKRSDGLVLIDSDKCIGCKYCMVACPYSARIFHWKQPKDKGDLSNLSYSPETSVPVKTGTVGKCDFCPDLAKNGVLPHCITACPEGVIFMGDQNEDTVTNGTETYKLSKLLKDKAGYRHLEYFGTEPNVYYLPPVDRIYDVEVGDKKS